MKHRIPTPQRSSIWKSIETGHDPPKRDRKQYFTGTVRIDPLVQAPEPSRVTAGLRDLRARRAVGLAYASTRVKP